ncbi:hypothetical protein [Rhizobium sp. Leaf371]|uniref:hypothetical protein n=1 Tax=Rhizobium sp. Leaf371 TaxID=1736355 RepID=UPI000A8AD673|nr:hypothetical protein [Rhizobium sp. Leaf371]
MNETVARLAWSSTRCRCATTGMIIGIVFAMLLPGFGIASGGKGTSGFGVALIVFALIGWLVGRSIGVEFEDRKKRG